MKAAQISEYGDPTVVKINQIDKPVAGPGQVLVEVHASSLNPFDSKVRQGQVPIEMPATLGGDIAGVIVEIGEGIHDFAAGDRVYGQAAAVAGNSGAFAEFAATRADQIAKAPTNLNFTEIAALPLVGVSAMQALTEQINLQPKQKIFIHGGAGGIGSIAIQIAKHIGAYIATTASAENTDFVKKLGADEIIDYKSQDFAEILHDYDAVFDTVGGDDFDKSLGILKPGGVAISMIAPPDDSRASELGVSATALRTQVNTARLDKLRQLIESDVVKPQIGQIFPLDEIQQAFTARESGSVHGKVVVEISSKR
jgi:alcohol dehydrogenase